MRWMSGSIRWPICSWASESIQESEESILIFLEEIERCDWDYGFFFWRLAGCFLGKNFTASGFWSLFFFENKIFTVRPQVYQNLAKFVRCTRVSALHHTLIALLVNWMGLYPQFPTR